MDIFDAPVKSGFGVGIKIVVTDDNGEQISSIDKEMFGFDNKVADIAVTQVEEKLDELVEAWKQYKYGDQKKR